MNPFGGRFLTGAATVVMIVAIIAGLSVLGSPAHQRALRLDAQRASAINMLSFVVGSYWNQHKTLPSDLQATSMAIGTDKDPVSGLAYTYVPGSADRYQLCAVFDAASERISTTVWNGRLDGPSWKHPAGRHCFNFSAEKMGVPEAYP
jgi:hypothetical protein